MKPETERNLVGFALRFGVLVNQRGRFTPIFRYFL